MPDSQENEWEDLGYTTEVNIEIPEIDWDAFREAMNNLSDSIRAIRPQMEEQVRRLRLEFNGVHSIHSEYQIRRIRESESMAVDIRHGEYPSWDSYGTYWYDPSGFHSDEPHVCFICSRPTGRIDIDFHGAFCNSEECNEVIRQDLERANGGPENEEV
ncbi:hypothetical protein KNV00_gp059 [Streptomyces phage Bmoc]|uniref:Uncharacterized protein n=1 Tax=Streptomyces phage Bmoc TaxID=2725629 RepID=A0A6M3T0E9_9CAUD|nr:hypothetical protein KNV00_gp059 [Streptomyces phage Bmoc]QJD50960.1 hypothetical protein SEA_BMOC_252 [Streptomyces phage Bmoc]